MTITMTRPPVELLPGVRVVFTADSRHTQYWRLCDRCGHERQVKNPRAKKNLCADCCFSMSRSEIERWVA